MAIRKPRGTQDFLPEQMINWHYIEQRMREICKVYGFNEIRTPAFEDTKLFLRGIGETTDVVQKEMYTFYYGVMMVALALPCALKIQHLQYAHI